LLKEGHDMMRAITNVAVLITAGVAWGFNPKYCGAPFNADGEANNIHDAGLYHLQLYDRLWVGDVHGGYGGGNYPGKSGVFTLWSGDFWVGTNAWGTPRVSGGMWGEEWYEVAPLVWSDGSSWEERPAYVEKWGDLDSFLIVDDSKAEEAGPIGLVVEQHGLQWSDVNNDDYVLFHYRVINDAGRDLDDVYVCLLYDFDVGGLPSYREDKVGVDASRKMPYMYDDVPAHPYVGLYVVDGKAAAGGAAWRWSNNADQWGIMTAASWYEAVTPSDYQAFVSSGPHAIKVGEKLRFGFAVVAGADLAELQANADAAYKKYWEVFTGLTEFEARATAGGVVIRWVPDRPYAGYNLYRAEAGGVFGKLNAAAITGRPPFVYADAGVAPARSYEYKLEALTFRGASEWFGPVEVKASDAPKAAFSFRGPSPNPSRGRASFSLNLATAGPVVLTAYDLSGRRVVSESLWCGAGERVVTLDTGALPSGVYIYRASCPDGAASGKMVVVR
jgi:hypothetical protein